MQCVLNFSGEEKMHVLTFLKQFPERQKGTEFEEFRCLIGKSSVTLYRSGKVLAQGPDCEEVKEKLLKAVDVGGELIFGVDETGRGESTGPFVIVGVLGRAKRLRELRDSKKTKDIDKKSKIVEENAEDIKIKVISSEELSDLHEKGISMNQIEAETINEWQKSLEGIDEKLEMIVDGSPLKGCNRGISFLEKGDDLNPVIGAASVVAKMVRNDSDDKGERRDWGNWQKKAKK